MEKLDLDLVQYLNNEEVQGHRRELYELLEVDLEDPSGFFLIPLQNLRSVIDNGGLYCNSAAPLGRIDISADSIQARREYEIDLKGYKSKAVHDCLNLFFNPTNDTAYAFQRNALIRAYTDGQTDNAIVCVLRYSLEALLNTPGWGWTVTQKNLAAGGRAFTSFSQRFYGDGTWPWKEIMSLKGEAADDLNAQRAAEIVLHRGEGDASQPIPHTLISEVIVSTRDADRVREVVPELADRVRALDAPKVFHSASDLLYTEGQLLGRMFGVEADGLSAQEFGADLARFPHEAASRAGELTISRFEHERIALDHRHGIGHVTRVAFWAMVLHRLAEESDSTLTEVLAAAALHDLCRFDNNSEPTHGELAAKRHSDWIRDHFPDADAAKRVSEAVTFHSRPKSDYPDGDTNAVWQILNDADGLERGRFARPETEYGWQPDEVRSRPLRQDMDFTRGLAWIAWRVAWCTKYTRWTDPGRNTYQQFTDSMMAGIRACLATGVLTDGRDMDRAQRFVQGFATAKAES